MSSMNVCNATDELFLEYIIGFHSFAGCDTVSTFSSWGKAKHLKLIRKSFHYIEAFSMFGKEITLADSLVNKLEMFVCHMYGWKEKALIMLGYCMYCKSGGKVSCDTLPPTNNVLHISRANYQTYICWQSLVAQQEQLDTIYHGWMHDGKENCLTLKLMKCKPAPNEVRKLIPNFYT